MMTPDDKLKLKDGSEVWFDGEDMLQQFPDGKITRYTKVSIVGYQSEAIDSPNVKVEKMSFVGKVMNE